MFFMIFIYNDGNHNKHDLKHNIVNLFTKKGNLGIFYKLFTYKTKLTYNKNYNHKL